MFSPRGIGFKNKNVNTLFHQFGQLFEVSVANEIFYTHALEWTWYYPMLTALTTVIRRATTGKSQLFSCKRKKIRKFLFVSWGQRLASEYWWMYPKNNIKICLSCRKRRKSSPISLMIRCVLYTSHHLFPQISVFLFAFMKCYMFQTLVPLTHTVLLSRCWNIEMD